MIVFMLTLFKEQHDKGKYAPRYLAAAKAMVEAVGAVPAWIMPLHRVVQSFQAKPEIFDVVIVDEASQCDLRTLPVLFRGKKVLVVGDPEQISPSHIGINEDEVFNLNRQFLSDIPYADTTFLMKNSLYDISKTIPSMDRTLLTEHFRCVPSIIEFNNHLCPTYAGKLEPLRQPNPVEMLDPPINTVFVETGYKDNNDVNKPEAEALVDMLVKCCRDDIYSKGGKNNRKRTMGVISLLGEKQAKYIAELIHQRLDETEINERKIICGDAYAFQGDERDVMFLSLVIASNAQFMALVKDADRQRFNVATSRARDQAYLYHSVRIGDIRNSECVRYKLLSWYFNHPLAEIESGIEVLKQKAESDFEIEVGERIIRRGYKVIPQYRPLPNVFNYRIDLVVQGEKNRLAVECDGDRFHGSEKWENDQRRETQLWRAGWKFWRISGSAFYRNKVKSLEGLWHFLEAEGIEPILFIKQSESKSSSTSTNASKNESIKENFNKKPNDETKKKDYPKSKSTPVPLTPHEVQINLFDKKKIPQLSTNWKVWREISEWGKKTMAINEYWWNLASDISKRLKEKKEISPKQRGNMNKCWKTVFIKGFILKEKKKGEKNE